MPTQQTRTLLSYAPKIPAFDGRAVSEHEAKLYGVWMKLNGSSADNVPTVDVLLDALEILERSPPSVVTSSQPYDESSELRDAILTKLVFGVYTHFSETLLNESIEAEAEAYWWTNIERNSWGCWCYFVQTLPLRLVRLGRKVAAIANEQNIHTFGDTFNRLAVPHVEIFNALFPSLKKRFIFPRSPLALIREECSEHHRKLQRIRDKRAEQLGCLTFLGANVRSRFETRATQPSNILWKDPKFLHDLQLIMAGDTSQAIETSDLSDTLTVLHQFLTQLLPRHVEAHHTSIRSYQRPPRWTRAWPKVFFGPPLFLLIFRSIYNNRSSIRVSLIDAKETIRGFWVQWVVEPVREILNTVRTGGESGPRVTSKEGLKSDMESLERMVISLATEKQNWSNEELKDLSQKIRQGDLTPVLEMYEDDIKKPLRSAVDIDFALEGIDKLLRSQELTFGFVGVAPSLTVLYVVGGWIRSLLGNGSRWRPGDKRRREVSLHLIRRIERLLLNAGMPIPPSESPSSDEPSSKQLPALTQGLLIVSLTHLRRYAESSLPRRSRLREGFLEDLSDLEESSFDKEEKFLIVQRMWRSWGQDLGWGCSVHR
ncbi:ATP synthase regulation protein NCA2-domain-containing protein [Cantharellus anzutake]|uniref:ATP synthase regulation protein NCA2-domain-containing protein n=1 Tax=Cantharellus anzutake TaxID=1750568 RepID=UPI0019087865|nr:ATP synthase regulation protein NCA2-domain-containing protein [Cantharellus anzutake]KAF8342777.1 ATP synthase regulation protein NCA2-domain-containing protein [Cantharellus anzutake]